MFLMPGSRARLNTSIRSVFQRLTNLEKQQAFKNIGLATPGGYANIFTAGSSSTITVTADAVALFDSSQTLFPATSVSFSINTATNGANGLDTGSIATGEYFYFVIHNPTTGATNGLLSLSQTAPTMPSGFTYKRRIGWIYYTGGAVTTFVQRNAQFTWSGPRTVASGTSVLTTFTLATFCSPVASRVFGYLISNNNTVQVNDNTNSAIAVVAGIASGQCFFQWSFTPINSTYQISYSSTSGGGTAAVTGWEDNI